MGVVDYFSSRPSLGLDIFSTEIRLLQLRRKKHHVYVEQAAIMALPFGAMTERKIQQPEVVTAHLKTLVQQTHTQGAKVTIALPIQSVISKKIPRHEVTSMDTINRYFPGVSDALAYDYSELKEEVVLMATRHDELMHYVSVIEHAGLKVSIVDVDLYALVRAARFAIPNKELTQSILLLEFHGAGSQLILFDQSDIIYQQSIYGSMDEISAQLKSVLKIYFADEKNKAPETVYLLGDASDRSELIQCIRRELSMETQLMDPFDYISQYKLAIPILSNHFYVCCGLALRSVMQC